MATAAGQVQAIKDPGEHGVHHWNAVPFPTAKAFWLTEI